MLLEKLIIILVFSLTLNEVEKYKPKPYTLGNGDTLMVRTKGYGFCPEYCEVDHFHVGHKEGYKCENIICEHIIYEDRVN